MNRFQLKFHTLVAIGLVVLAFSLPVLGSPAEAGTGSKERPAQKGGYALTPVLAVGGADADDEAAFYERFGPILVDSDDRGNMYVLDSGNVRVQVFDSYGNFVRSLGAEGEGPGEFQIMGRLSVNAKGDVAVSDVGQGRVSVLGAEGELLWDQVVGGGVKEICLANDGTLFLGYGAHGPAAVEAYDSSGNLVLTAGTNTPSGPQVIEIEIGSQTVAPRLEWNPDGRFFRTPKGEYLVQVFGAGGDETRITRSFERREISVEEMFPAPDENGEGGPQVVMIKKEVSAGGGEPKTSASTSHGWEDEEGGAFDPSRLKQFLPKHHPDTRGILAWPDGRLWIVTSHDEQDGMVTDEWSVDGEYLRRFVVPGEYDVLRVGSDGALYGVTHDEDDYPTAHRIEVKTGA